MIAENSACFGREVPMHGSLCDTRAACSLSPVPTGANGELCPQPPITLHQQPTMLVGKGIRVTL
jgi:hypothetical protein